jgi:hypothetical protein
MRGTPPRLSTVSLLYSELYDFHRMQNSHSRWVRGKFFSLKDLQAPNVKAPRLVGAFSCSGFIITERR